MWFVVAVVIGEIQRGQTAGVPIMAGWIVALTGLTVGLWRWPRLGGLVLIATGIGAGLNLANPCARVLLALPAVLIGVTSLLSPPARTSERA